MPRVEVSAARLKNAATGSTTQRTSDISRPRERGSRRVGPAVLGADPDRRRRGDHRGDRDHAARSNSAACSGGRMFRWRPAPSSSPARWVRRGTTSIRQQKYCAPRGAVRTQRFSGGRPPSARSSRPSVACSSRARQRPAVLEPRARRARDDLQLERHARGERADRHRLGVVGDEALAQPHLLLHQVLEQVAPVRAIGVGGEALALAGDRRAARTAARTAARACAAATRRPRGPR